MILPGSDYTKQIECRSAIISWSHRARFKMAIRLISEAHKFLDYGCGDGTFLASIAGRVTSGLGVDIAADRVRDCATRLAEVPNLQFRHVDELTGPQHDHSFDTVTCMETLEHCTEGNVERVLADLNRLCRPEGRIVISVPIEIGPSFLLKYAIRTVAGWRRLSDYRYYERYSLGDAFRMLAAGKETIIERPIYREPGGEFHSHYGFNWRKLREQVGLVLCLERTCFSPLGFLGGWVSSQAWFICRPRIEECNK